MRVTPRISTTLRYLAVAGVLALAAGCASTPQHAAAQSSSGANTPASASSLVDMAKFTTRAQDEGWAPEVRGGNVLYCKDETPIDSRFPEKTCLNKADLRQRMLAEEHQRQALQQGSPAGCRPPPYPC